MVHVIRIGGLLGIIISLFLQLFAVIDDSYSFGNFGILGILCGVLGTYSSFIIERKSSLALGFLFISVVGGFYAISFFYMIPAILMVIPSLIINSKMNHEKFTS